MAPKLKLKEKEKEKGKEKEKTKDQQSRQDEDSTQPACAATAVAAAAATFAAGSGEAAAQQAKDQLAEDAISSTPLYHDGSQPAATPIWPQGAAGVPSAATPPARDAAAAAMDLEAEVDRKRRPEGAQRSPEPERPDLGHQGHRASVLDSRIELLEKRISRVEETSSWCAQELMDIQAREAIRCCRLIGLPELIETARLERMLHAWLFKNGFQPSAIQLQSTARGRAAMVHLPTATERARLTAEAVAGRLLVAGTALRAQRTVPAYKQLADRPLKEAAAVLRANGITELQMVWPLRTIVVAGLPLVHVHWATCTEVVVMVPPGVCASFALQLEARWQDMRRTPDVDMVAVQTFQRQRYEMASHVALRVEPMDEETCKDIAQLLGSRRVIGESVEANEQPAKTNKMPKDGYVQQKDFTRQPAVGQSQPPMQQRPPQAAQFGTPHLAASAKAPHVLASGAGTPAGTWAASLGLGSCSSGSGSAAPLPAQTSPTLGNGDSWAQRVACFDLDGPGSRAASRSRPKLSGTPVAPSRGPRRTAEPSSTSRPFRGSG